MKNGPGRILLIEDEATSREISLLILEGAGYEIDAANCAVAAHERLSSAPYSLVIADWLLPDGDGIYLADRRIQARRRDTGRNRPHLGSTARNRQPPSPPYKAIQPYRASHGRESDNRRAMSVTLEGSANIIRGAG